MRHQESVHEDRTVFGRAFRILETFNANNPRLSMTDLSRRTATPLPTVHRICMQLVAKGVLERDADGCLSIGVRIWELGALAPRAHGLRQVAMPYLEDLYEATHENVQLVVLDGNEALYIERLSGRGAIPLLSRAGGLLPLHASSGGLVLLAHAGPALLEDVLARGLKKFTPLTIDTEHRLRATLGDIRRTGHVICRQHLDMHTVAVAAPLVNADRVVVAAISVVIRSESDPAPLVPAVRAAARGISRHLR